MKEGLVKALTEKVDTAEMIVNAFARRLQDRNSNRGRTLMDSQSVFEAVATVQVFGEAIRQINLGMEFETLQQFFMDQLLVAARHPDRLPKSDACRMFATETMNASANCLAEICDWPY
jgi:hypothetical protein